MPEPSSRTRPSLVDRVRSSPIVIVAEAPEPVRQTRSTRATKEHDLKLGIHRGGGPKIRQEMVGR